MRSPQLLVGLLISVSAIVEAKEPHSPAESSVCTNEPNELVPDGCASYSTIENLNKKLYPLLQEITQKTDYFGYYRLDLYGRTCPFWSDDEGMCGNIACAVTTIEDEKDIPLIWRAEELGKLAGPKASHPVSRAPTEPSPLGGALGMEREESCIVEDDECDERDYCVPEDESAGGRGDYVSLTENPERFTGYTGAGAANVWKAIYRENCFDKHDEYDVVGQVLLGGFSKQNSPAAMEFANVIQEKGKHELETKGGQQKLLDLDVNDECLEKRVFHRVISGMHASISMHLCWDYLNQSTGEWGPNLDCFIARFKGHPERIQNIYFNYALLTRAVAKLRRYLDTYTFCSGDYYQNRLTRSKVLKLVTAASSSSEPIFDESLMFKDEMIGLKEEFRNRFRNVSRLMDCVGCDKCRLWGKVQTQGFGTALKVLFEFDESAVAGENPILRRTELVALVNTLDRVSHSLVAFDKFKAMWDAEKNVRIKTGEELEIDDELSEEEDNEEDEGLWDMFWKEWYMVWTIFGFVIKSWIDLPKNLFIIALSYLSQFWDSSWRSTVVDNAKSEL